MLIEEVEAVAPSQLDFDKFKYIRLDETIPVNTQDRLEPDSPVFVKAYSKLLDSYYSYLKGGKAKIVALPLPREVESKRYCKFLGVFPIREVVAYDMVRDYTLLRLDMCFRKKN